ncbi:MAG: hypothetical protein D6824_03485 [Planctomycetota bacterium]|nr:MAG: hypothetical protein D6824_03485 [Planctomycetota bacterium]
MRRSRKPAQSNGLAAHALHYAARTAVAAVGAFGLEDASATVRSAARWWARSSFNAQRHRRAKANIAWAFPEADAAWVERTAVASYEHLFLLAAELAALPRLITPSRWFEHVELGDVREGLELLAEGRPAILITGHCGCWEALGYTLAALGVPLHALYRPLNQKPLDDWVRRVRASRGLALLDKFGATERIPAIIEQGGCVGFLADQNAGDRGLFVPFFNRLASSYKSIGLLAMRYELPLLCGAAFRLPAASRKRFRIELVDVILPQHWKDADDPLFFITCRYRWAIETMVRMAPEQYLWMHRAWKSRPRHERLGRPFPPALRQKLASLPWMTQPSLERIIERSRRDAAQCAAR